MTRRELADEVSLALLCAERHPAAVAARELVALGAALCVPAERAVEPGVVLSALRETLTRLHHRAAALDTENLRLRAELTRERECVDLCDSVHARIGAILGAPETPSLLGLCLLARAVVADRDRALATLGERERLAAGPAPALVIDEAAIARAFEPETLPETHGETPCP